MKTGALFVLVFAGCSGSAAIPAEPAPAQDAGADAAPMMLPPVDADGDGYAVGVDCDDTDERVHPGQTAFFDTKAKGGGWDFNCDGQNEQEWKDVMTCFVGGSCRATGAPGWGDIVPPCGVAGLNNYWPACLVEYMCGPHETRTQACR